MNTKNLSGPTCVAAWITASQLSFRDLSRRTNIPYNVIAGPQVSMSPDDVAIIAEALDVLRPFDIDGEIAARLEAATRELSDAKVSLSVSRPERRGEIQDRYEALQEEIADLESLGAPLAEQWDSLAEGWQPYAHRQKHCILCDYRWNARGHTRPVRCPHCRTPYWDEAPKQDIKTCRHCRLEWAARVREPKKCPRCQRPDWNVEASVAGE